MIFNGLLSNVKARLNDWLNTTSSNVTGSLALDLCNRGREMIWQECDWEPLLKRADLTVNPTTKSATLPADFGKIINCNFDPLGYGKAVGYYSKDGDIIYGYKIDSNFDAVTGFTPPTITWFYALSYTPNLVYKATLSRFADQEADQPTFFPENLLLRAAQLQHIAENGIGTQEYTIIRDEYLRELWRYKAQVQGVNSDMRNQIKDDAGNIVRIVAISNDGGNPQPRPISPSLDNKYGM